MNRFVNLLDYVNSQKEQAKLIQKKFKKLHKKIAEQGYASGKETN